MNDDSSFSDQSTRFAEQSEQARPTLIGKFIFFLKYNKKWWLTPILLVMVILGALMLFGGSAAAPFVYTLF